MSRRHDRRSIEADIERDREKLASAFDALLSRSTLDFLAREGLSLLRSNAGSYRDVAQTVVRRNPLAVAVTGLGLAWLVFGRSRAAERDDDEELAPRRRSRARRAAAEIVDPLEDHRWSDSVDRLRKAASAKLRKLEEEGRASYDDLREGLSDRADDARDFVAERAEVLADLADGLKRRFAMGLDDLSDSARDRIITAREEAYAARLRAEETLGKGGREAKRLVEDHPMVAAALALGLGAALGAVLTRSRSAGIDEDDLDVEDEDDLEDTLEEARASWRDRKAARTRR